MLINGRDLTVNDREPTADDLAQMASRYTWARMPEETKQAWSATATELRGDTRWDGWNPWLGIESI